jgi:hypothetical protein
MFNKLFDKLQSKLIVRCGFQLPLTVLQGFHVPRPTPGKDHPVIGTLPGEPNHDPIPSTSLQRIKASSAVTSERKGRVKIFRGLEAWNFVAATFKRFCKMA